MNYESIRLEKGMYHVPNKSFTQVLEEMDPSYNYVGTPLEKLDAFERQLKRYDIKVAGATSSAVEDFYKTTDASALFPEYLARAIRQGMEEANVLEDIVATTTQIDSLDYRTITSNPSDDAKEMKYVDEGALIPSTTVSVQQNLVSLKKRGRLLEASYEAIRFQKLDLFTVTLKQIGRYLAYTLMQDAVTVLIDGDGNGNPAPVEKTAKSGTLTYNDLIAFWNGFGAYELNTILVSPDIMLKMLSIDEFKNPLTGLNFQGTGHLTTPIGANLIKSTTVPEGQLIGLDKRCALERVIAADVTVEYDKLIDRQLDRAAITTISGFSKIFTEASKLLKITYTE